MTIEEAREILGIDASATPDDARRAYTRLIKKHKPEREPEQFQRVRAAYERVNEAPTMDLQIEAPAPVAPLREIDPAVEERERALALARAALAEEIDLALRERRMDSVIGLLRTHFVAHPGDDETRRSAMGLLGQLGAFEAMLAIAADGCRVAREPLSFAATLCFWKPSSVDDALLDRVAEDPRHAPSAAVARVARGDIDGARRVITRAIELDIEARRERRDLWLRVVAALVERGSPALAREVYARLDDVAPAIRSQGSARATEALLRELLDVADAIDPEVRGIFGAFVAAPPRGLARMGADPLLVDRHSPSFAVLRTRAPALLRQAMPQLFVTHRPARPVPKGLIVLAVLFIGFATFVGVRHRILNPELYPPERSPETRAICDRHIGTACDASLRVDYHLSRAECREAGAAVMDLMDAARGRADVWPEALHERARVLEHCPELR